jgi:hypothetical protein
MQRNSYWPLVSRRLDSIVVFLLAEGRDQLRFKIYGADGKLTIELFKKRESILMPWGLQPSKFVGPPLMVDELIYSAAVRHGTLASLEPMENQELRRPYG